MYQSIRRINKKDVTKASKEFIMIVINGSLKKDLNELPAEKIEDYYKPRFKEVVRRRGYNICLSALDKALKKIEENPSVVLKNKDGDYRRINLIYEPLSTFYDNIAYEKVNGDTGSQ
jgi:hypothetical protein